MELFLSGNYADQVDGSRGNSAEVLQYPERRLGLRSDPVGDVYLGEHALPRSSSEPGLPRGFGKWHEDGEAKVHQRRTVSIFLD